MKPVSVYVHIPFCTVKCGYCDFNAYAGLDSLKDAYARALVTEIEVARPLLSDHTVVTVAFGGGTPGEVPAAHIAAVLEAITKQWAVEPGAEVSLEANPVSTNAQHLRELRAAGVTRISFGVQSLDAEELRFLDRLHSPEAAAASVANARREGIASVGVDLIYGLPGQSLASWQRSLQDAIALEPDHISAYALTIEDGTPLARRVSAGEVVPLDGDAVADMYESAEAILEKAGFEHYEISNWAKPGHRSRHNLGYWTDREYLAIGAGAHGYLAGERYENVAHPRDYIAAVEGSGLRPALLRSYIPDESTAMFDWVTLRLRLIEGFPVHEFEQRFGKPLDAVFGEPLRAAAQAGVLAYGAQVRLTPRGRLLHAELAAELLAFER